MELIIHNRVPDLDIVRRTVNEFGEQMGLDETEMMRLNLVMEEAVSNVILYAYPRSEDQQISISFFSDEGPQPGTMLIRVVIKDSGMEFDPTRRDSPDIDQPLEERRIGGLGIFLIKKYMDTVDYKRTGGFNVLTLTKTITK